MSIETLTGDEFMNLDAATHRDALEQYEQAVEVLTHNLGHRVYEREEDRSRALDKLTSHLTLRKLHKARLAELEDDAVPAAQPGRQEAAMLLATAEG